MDRFGNRKNKNIMLKESEMTFCENLVQQCVDETDNQNIRVHDGYQIVWADTKINSSENMVYRQAFNLLGFKSFYSFDDMKMFSEFLNERVS